MPCALKRNIWSNGIYKSLSDWLRYNCKYIYIASRGHMVYRNYKIESHGHVVGNVAGQGREEKKFLSSYVVVQEVR